MLSYESVWQGRVRPWEVPLSPMLIRERRVAPMGVLGPLPGGPQAPPRLFADRGTRCRQRRASRPPGSAVDERYFTAPWPLQGALYKGVSWSWIKMSFYWRSANFKECRIYLSGCWLPATRLYLFFPLSFCFLVVFVFFPSLSVLTRLPLSHKEDGWVSPTLQSCFFSSLLFF